MTYQLRGTANLLGASLVLRTVRGWDSHFVETVDRRSRWLSTTRAGVRWLSTTCGALLLLLSAAVAAAPPADLDAVVKQRTLDEGIDTKAAGAKKGPSLDLPSYAGTYRDPWYGDVKIASVAGALQIDFTGSPGLQGALEHVRFDTFRTRFTDRRMEDAYVTFSVNADGAIDHAKLRAVSPLADFSCDYADLLLEPVVAR